MSVSFRVDVTPADALAFAEVSGDWNPLHTDQEHAQRTPYRQVVLHGAFSAGLFSRLAGMHLPGADCLLHGMRLRFVAPILPPASLIVSGDLVGEHGGVGRVDATISDAVSGRRYVEGVYEFGHHQISSATRETANDRTAALPNEPIIVTGGSGGLGRAVLKRLGKRAVGVSRRPEPGMLTVTRLEEIADCFIDQRIGGIVHCAWPSPDNQRLTALSEIGSAVEHSIAEPIRQIIALSQLLMKRGGDNAMLVLIGSTAAEPGRHNYRMPLYSLAKSVIPEMTRALATELAAANRRCASITFDVIDGGMNGRLTASTKIAHTDRAPSGRLPSVDEAAAQVEWLLDNANFLVSGATLTLTGAAAP